MIQATLLSSISMGAAAMVDINGHLFWGPTINLAWDSKETNSRLARLS
jgi:hypothetical protein